ncbi:4-alpha-glucanotransferase [Pelagibius marinus]|uniref:4-alpha-glucanotransferase n=1 Tax=Pelagibius marinus TaxID=2762760 RepID=UPI0018722EB2|nr:4-alpha-glucanotransferase [Pelagibius marinus]
MSGGASQTLAEALGILPEWHDIAGRHHITAPETQRALLKAMGVAAAGEPGPAESLAELEARRAARRLPEEVVTTPGAELRLPLVAPTEWRLDLEDGGSESGRAEETIQITPPAGLHRLTAGEESCLIIAAPETAPGVAEVLGRTSGRRPHSGGAHGWGVTAALYGLRSPRNLGVGDYADLAVAAEQLAGLGAAFLGINPLHARGAACDGISPYTPSCRTALEPRHIAVDAVLGSRQSETAQALLRDNAARLAAAREGELVDYATCDGLGNDVLRALFADFERSAGPAVDAFAAWRRGPGQALEWFALFEAISLRHGADWRGWPEQLQRFGSPAALSFATANAREVRYHAWLQWLAQRQLSAAQGNAKNAGMGLGLYLDIAVGVRPGGADTWSAPSCFAEGVSLGAPPDAFNPAGQDWALAPFNPLGLHSAAYRPFIEMLRAAMAYAGIIRIDHILGLRRSFWVPEDGAPGGYVAYPLEPLLALIRLEARRAGCVVVGEDLGSVPPGLRDRLAEAGLLGCAVVQFEKQDQRFHPPEGYRAATLASFGTHDTPTLRGWWCGWDIDQRHAINGGDEAGHEAERQQRAAERAALARLLCDENLAPTGLDPDAPPPQADDALAEALHRLLARAGSALVAVQLDDALGSVAQQNLPGTVDEHPNWRRRYPLSVEELGSDPRLRALAALFAPRAATEPQEDQSQEMKSCP